MIQLSHASIDTDLEIIIDNAYRAAAKLHLQLFRQELKQYNLKRHPVKVVEQCGQPTLYVGDHIWFQYRPGSELTDKLIGIGGTIDAAPWAKHLIGETLCTAKD